MTRKIRLVLSVLLVGAFGAVVFNAGSTYAAAVGGKGCGPDGCLDVWNPVICSNGVVYSNMCYAARACAKGCVAY